MSGGANLLLSNFAILMASHRSTAIIIVDKLYQFRYCRHRLGDSLDCDQKHRDVKSRILTQNEHRVLIALCDMC